MSTSPRARSESFASELSSSGLPEYTDETGGFTKQTRPFLHPSISRLRSSVVYTPQLSSANSSNDALSPLRESAPSSPSRLTAASRSSSLSNLHALGHSQSYNREYREPFRWTSLQIVNEFVYFKRSHKATAVLGSPIHGTPTTLAANSRICVGTDAGKVWVFDFKQQLICICGDEQAGTLHIISPVSYMLIPSQQVPLAR